MDAATFRETVEAEKRTELERLGSSKLLLALTDADLTDEAVYAAAAHSEHAARETFAAWAGDEPDEGAREAFGAVAAQERDHYERVAANLPDEFEPADGGPLHEFLRGVDGAVARAAAGLVGRGLVSLRTHMQVIGYFVNEADTAGADLFRDLRSETEESLETGLELLAERCESDEEWEQARGPAEYAIQVAYDDYADSLEGLGIDPKPLC
jgi:hypothetical protein